MQKKAKEYAKRTKAVLKEFQKKLRPKSIQERIMYNMMINNFINAVEVDIKNRNPEESKEAIVTLIKRLMWIIE